jgi:hypothetical protein
MRKVIFVFVKASHTVSSESGAYLNKAGTNRMLELRELLRQIGAGSLGKMKICAEKMSVASTSADFFGKLNGVNSGEIELYCGICDEARTMTTHFAPSCDTLVFFDEVGSIPLLAEYCRIAEELGADPHAPSKKMYESGVISALAINLETKILTRISTSQTESSAA